MESKWKHAIGNSVFALRTVYRYAPAAACVYSLFMLTSSAFVVVQILFLEKLVSHAAAYIQNPTDSRMVFLWGALYVASLFATRLYGFSETKLKLFLVRKLTRSLSPSIMEKFSRIAYQYYENKEFQDCLSRMTSDPQQSIQDAFYMVNVGVNQLLKLAGILGIFFRASMWIGIGAALIGIPMSVLNLSATYRQQQLMRNASTDQRMGEYIQELFYDKHSAYEIKIFRAREYLLDLWRKIMKKIFARSRQGQKIFLRTQAIVSLLKICYTSFTVITLTLGFLSGTIELGVFVSVLNAIGTLFGNLNAAAQSIFYLGRNVYEIGYYREFLGFEEQNPGTEHLEPGGKSDIRFENVCFRYPGTEREILHNLSFHIQAGEKVALVGVNGAGKSTIVKLLCGLYTPDSGQITIGGKDISSLSGEALHKAVSVVFQDFGSYQLTLRENIAFGNLEKLNSDADLKEALSLAGEESISDKGLDIPLGRLEEDGMDLSGGQWQKIAIARAFLSNADFIILLFALPLLLGIVTMPLVDIYISEKHHMLIHKLLAHIVSLPLIRFEDPQFHNEIWRAKRCIYNKGLLNYFYGFTDFVPIIVRFAGMVGVLASYDIRFVPVALLSIVPAFISKWIYNQKKYLKKRRQTPLMRRRDYLWKVLTERDTVKELRTMQTTDYVKARWTAARDEVVEQDFAFEWKSSDIFLFCDLFRLAGSAVSIALAIYFAGSGIISIGQFAACIAAFGSMQSLTEQLVGMVAEQNNKADFAGDYYDFFDYAQETDGKTLFPGLTKEIAVRNVSFAYPSGESDVLRDVSFTIRKGERVVIVGENGSGKTTLSKIISGVYLPGTGEILYDGANIKDFESDSFYRHFSVISQNFVKYQLTMRENIGISTPEQIHNDNKLMQSAKAANADSIVKRAGGLDEQLGREFDGVELSGGEWQKIAIARGLNKDADLIILDEPTSALDPLVEYDILKKFIDLTQGKTSVIISHRVGLCRFADRIIVMQNGRVVGNGSHEELLRNNAEYARIWNEQAKWYEG